MIPLTKQGAPLKSMLDTAKKALNGAPAADLAADTIAASKAGSKGGRVTNWIKQQSKPFAASVATNIAAGGFPLYQTLQTLRKFLAGKGTRFTNDRIAALEKAIASAQDYERAPLISKLNQYKSLNAFAKSQNKQSYPGIWAGAAASVPAAYAAHKLWDWTNWSALDNDQREALTSQGERPTTVGEDVNNLISRAASYYKGIKRLPDVYGAASNDHKLLKNIRDNRPYGVGDRANEVLRKRKQHALVFQGQNGFAPDSQGASDLYDSNTSGDYTTPQLPTYTNGITYDPANNGGYKSNPDTGITMRH